MILYIKIQIKIVLSEGKDGKNLESYNRLETFIYKAKGVTHIFLLALAARKFRDTFYNWRRNFLSSELVLLFCTSVL